MAVSWEGTITPKNETTCTSRLRSAGCLDSNRLLEDQILNDSIELQSW